MNPSHPNSRRTRLAEFLKTKRAQARPADFGLPEFRRRRVQGLRREEVALLAGMSVTWYTQLESGAPITVSPALLRRLADVLRLSQLERAFLFSMAIEEMETVSSVLFGVSVLPGTHIEVETFADEVALVLHTHRALKTQIYSALLHGSVDGLVPLLDEQQCPIGIWLHDDLAPNQRRSSHYESAARAHRDFHREIHRLVEAGLSGAHTQVEELVAASSPYAATSAVLERAFSAWNAS